jgi:hypothetical protein
VCTSMVVHLPEAGNFPLAFKAAARCLPPPLLQATLKGGVSHCPWCLYPCALQPVSCTYCWPATQPSRSTKGTQGHPLAPNPSKSPDKHNMCAVCRVSVYLRCSPTAAPALGQPPCTQDLQRRPRAPCCCAAGGGGSGQSTESCLQTGAFAGNVWVCVGLGRDDAAIEWVCLGVIWPRMAMFLGVVRPTWYVFGTPRAPCSGPAGGGGSGQGTESCLQTGAIRGSVSFFGGPAVA